MAQELPEPLIVLGTVIIHEIRSRVVLLQHFKV